MNVSAVRLAEVRALTIAESFTTTETARLLGVSGSTVTRRRAKRTLYAFRYGTRWRFAAWQVSTAAAIPGINELAPAIPPSMHPAFVRGLMLAPRRQLVDGDELKSPRDFLIEGGDPARIIALFEALDAL
jgi:excisionase family DNA binding protein